ncbi:MAG: hypothetical protein KGZ25_05320 [Planctomycetes bacterium]|nr:hypothetical protein [Planctomycetota bacterium]
MIDPTWRLTVIAMDAWYPGPVQGKALANAAVKDLGTTCAFASSYLAEGITAEIASQALKRAIKQWSANATKNHAVFVPPD